MSFAVTVKVLGFNLFRAVAWSKGNEGKPTPTAVLPLDPKEMDSLQKNGK